MLVDCRERISQYNDPYLNRFQQPDSIVPGAGNPQAFNRYSYVLNQPINFIDPTGHRRNPNNICTSDGDCDTHDSGWSSVSILGLYGVIIIGDKWPDENIDDAAIAAIATGKALAEARGRRESAAAAFRNVFGPMFFVWGQSYNGKTIGGLCSNFLDACSPGYDSEYRVNVIGFDVDNYSGLKFSTLVTHELGHIFSYHYGFTSNPHRWGASDGTSGTGSDWLSSADKILRGPPPASTYRHASASSSTEMFADMFTAWVFDAWNDNPLTMDPRKIDAARADMIVSIADWIP